MNFYKHHLGDYDGATAHLSWDEDMAYTRLLRAYYRTEKPIPCDQAYRLARASSKAQRAAVDSVLVEFFPRDGDVYRNKRADEEIAAYQAQATTNRRIANTRKGKRTDHEPSNESLHESSTQRTPNQEPEAKNQKPEEEKQPSLAVQIAIALRSAGVKNANSMNPDIQGWADDGVTVEQAKEAARIAIEDRQVERPSVGYLIGILADMRKPAKQRLPNGKPWFIASSTAIEEKGREKGITQLDDESFPTFKARVFRAWEITPDQVRQAEADYR